MRKFVHAITLATVLPVFAHASSLDAGGVVLTIYPGAVATGMGGAFTSLPRDATVMYYNVGALAFRDMQREFILQHSNWLRGLIDDALFEFFAFSYPLKGRGVVGGSITYLTPGLIGLQDPNTGVEYEFVPYDVVVSLGFSRKLNSNISAGIAGKFIYSFLIPSEILREVFGEVGDGTAKTWALDAGILYQKPFTFMLGGRSIHAGTFRFGASIQNIGRGLEYSGSGTVDPLPTTLRLGISLEKYSQAYNLGFVLSADVSKVLVNIDKDYRDSSLSFIVRDAYRHVGLEINVANLVFARLGYFHDELGRRMGLTYGFGAKYGNFVFDISDDGMIYEFNRANYVPNFRFQLGFVFEETIRPEDTLPNIIVHVSDASTGKEIPFSLNVYDSTFTKLVRTFSGKGKLTIYLPYGTYNISISSKNYETYKSKLEVDSKRKKIVAKLRKLETGKLVIFVKDTFTDKPIFANIRIDTMNTDTNMLSLELPEGIHGLRVSALNYEPFYTTVEVKANTTDTLVVYMKPIMVEVEFVSDSSRKVDILRGNQKVMSLDVQGSKVVELPLGSYEIVVEGKRFKLDLKKPERRTINLEEYVKKEEDS